MCPKPEVKVRNSTSLPLTTIPGGAKLKKIVIIFTVALIANMFFAVAASAATTGLNNIPIPQTKELGEWEWDLTVYLDQDLGKGRFFSNSLYGVVIDKLEIGFDWNLSRPVGPLKMSAKYQIWDEIRNGDVIGLAVGVENVQGTRGRGHDEPMYYIVISKQFMNNWAGYLGFMQLHSDDHSFFAGLDWRRDDRWQFRVDYFGYDDNNEGILAAGIQYDLAKHIGLAGWVNYDTFSEKESFVLELQFDANFMDLTMETGDY